MRRSVFDILRDEVVGSLWLDLYAGSGSFGIEALSRGAALAWFVESGEDGAQCLAENLISLALAPPEACLVRASLPGWLLTDPPIESGFGIVSMDPPFQVSRHADQLLRLTSALSKAASRGLFKPGALLLWEEPSDAPRPVPPRFEEVDLREHGTSRVRFLRVLPPETAA